MRIIEIIIALVLVFFLYTHFTGENPLEKGAQEVKGLQKTYTDSVEKMDIIKGKVDKNYEGLKDN